MSKNKQNALHCKDDSVNIDIPKGDFRPINLSIKPFSLGKPIELINEKCLEKNYKYKDKALGLWKLN